MAQLKDTIVNGSLTVADAAAITGPTQISSGDLTLYTSGTGNSPGIIFQRGALNDNYNDWQIQDRGDMLYFDQRGNGSTAFGQVISFATNGDITTQKSASAYKGTYTTAALTAARTWTFPDKTGTIAFTSDIPAVPSNIVNTITTSEGSYTALTSATGDVTIKLPTKTSHLTNDGDGTSAFARMSDIGSLGGGTITKVKTTAGAHTVIDVSSGDAEFNVPTKTSHLTNDSGFITSASIPQPLIGTTSTITPAQVMTAISEGRDIYISANSTLDGVPVELHFTGFNRATDIDFSGAVLDVVVSQTIARYDNLYYLFELVGGVFQGEAMPWSVMNSTLITSDNFPSSTNSATTGITASTDATKTTLGTAGSVIGVQSSTTTASKVTLSGSNSFSASVSNHVLSFSHGAQTVSASDVVVPIKDASATSIPNVSVTTATVSVTDPGHTHSLI